jgi:hypothetical protein
MSKQDAVDAVNRTLPNFNEEQLTGESIAALKAKVLGECSHLRESRKDLNSDFYGYITKVSLNGSDGVGYLILKSCQECASKRDTTNTKVVARLAYSMLSDHTVKAMYKNPGPYNLVPMSERAQKLAAEVAAGGPDTVN